jgi:hypothetical protein
MPPGPRNKLSRKMLASYDYFRTELGHSKQEAELLVYENSRYKQQHTGNLKRAVKSLVRRYRPEDKPI